MLWKGTPPASAASTELLPHGRHPSPRLLSALSHRAPLPAVAAASCFLCAHLPQKDTWGQSFDTAHTSSSARLLFASRTEPLFGGSRTLCDNLESNPQTRPQVMLFALSHCGPAPPACRPLTQGVRKSWTSPACKTHQSQPLVGLSKWEERTDSETYCFKWN